MKVFTKTMLLSLLLSTALFFSACVRNKAKKEESLPQVKVAGMTIPQMLEGYKNHRFTVRQVTETYLKRIRNLDQKGPHLNAIIVVNPDAIKIADSLDRLLAAGKAAGPLFGIPIVLKDNIDTQIGRAHV